MLTPQLDAEQVCVVTCDMTNNPANTTQLRCNYETGQVYNLVHLVCRIKATLSMLEIGVFVANGARNIYGGTVEEVQVGRANIHLTGGGPGEREGSPFRVFPKTSRT